MPHNNTIINLNVKFFFTASRIAGSRWMKKVKVGRFKHLKDSNETKDTEDDSLLTTQQVINSHTLNTPLIEPTETKVDITQTLSGGTMATNYNKRLSTKEKLMQQAGIGRYSKRKSVHHVYGKHCS